MTLYLFWMVIPSILRVGSLQLFFIWRYLSEIQSKGDDIMKSFIKTSDEQTADLLRKAGLYELAKEGDKFVFVNDMKKTFSLEDGKMFYTNKLCF